MVKRKMQKVCTMNIHETSPRIIGKVKGKQKWFMKLYIQNTVSLEGKTFNTISRELKFKERVVFNKIIEFITEQINEMMDEAQQEFGGYTDGGWELYRYK